MKTIKNGFTLLEFMIVVTIIGILASISLPQYQAYVQRTEMVEALSMASHYKEKTADYYEKNLTFPKDNHALGVPSSNLIIGNRNQQKESQL